MESHRLGAAAGGRAICHKFFIGNSPARRSEVNTIFREGALEAIDRASLYIRPTRNPRFRFAVQHGTDPNNSLANFQNCITL
jgi:hypothetical protein